jgi:nucleoside-diphosphate-sugar epimerase
LASIDSLITGGSGFIGQHLCRRLCAAGQEVHATSRRPRASGPSGLAWHQADLADLAAARRLFAALKPDIVYHLAGAVGANPDLGLVIPTFHSLLASTVNVLIAATEAGCRRIVLVGSLTEPLEVEGAAAIPHSPYAAAKWAASGYGRMFHALYGAPVVILRPFMTYGPGQAPSKLIPSVILSLLRGERPRLSSGKSHADWIYIEDVIEGFVAAAAAPAIEGETIDLGSGHLTRMSDLVGRLVKISGSTIEPDFGALPDRPHENAIAANVLLTEQWLGWRPTTSLYDGLKQTVEWYRASATMSVVAELCRAAP